MRETDLLAFDIGIEIGHPSAVMCAYNRVNGTYACENDFLLRQVLKQEWRYPGFVISDWLATHSTVASSHAGLDQEQPGNTFYGPVLKAAVEHGAVPQTELDEHVHRVLRSMFASGIVDDPPQKQVPPVFADARIARQVEQRSIVLLRNERGLLPLDPNRPQRILIVRRNADRGMISGGGSAQVDPPGGNAIGAIPEKDRRQDWQKAVWFPDAPLDAIRNAAPTATVSFDDGTDLARAGQEAAAADVVLLYAYQWQAEGMDLPTLALPDGQDTLIGAVTHANPSTVVLLETGGPVLMPWIGSAAAVLETCYASIQGAEAIADILFGRANPSGKLAVTFPLRDADLPHPTLLTVPAASREDWSDEAVMSKKLLAGLSPFPMRYDEGLLVGYCWYDAAKKAVLFPCGFGLSYTAFAYSGLHIAAGDDLTVQFELKNSGNREGEEIAQVYAALTVASGEPPKRLIGWSKVRLARGESRMVHVNVPKERHAVWEEGSHQWKIPSGNYKIMVGASSADLPLQQKIQLHEQ